MELGLSLILRHYRGHIKERAREVPMMVTRLYLLGNVSRQRPNAPSRESETLEATKGMMPLVRYVLPT